MFPTGQPGSLVAASAYDTTGGALTAGSKSRGCVAARTGVGVVTLTLDSALAQADCVAIVSPGRGVAANANAQLVHTSDTVKTISGFVAAVATEMPIDVAIFRISDGTSN